MAVAWSRQTNAMQTAHTERTSVPGVREKQVPDGVSPVPSVRVAAACHLKRHTPVLLDLEVGMIVAQRNLA